MQLSDKEIAILKFIKLGLTDDEISAALAMKRGTVSVYACRIVEKLGASNRTTAVIEGIKRSIIEL